MARAKKHVHKYHLVGLNATPVWACALPDCNHYMPDHMKKMVPGKMSICHGCGTEFVLDHEAMKDILPKCIECRTGVVLSDDMIPMSSAMEAFINRSSKVS